VALDRSETLAFSELKLQIVVALAGRSSRFKDKGIHIPKAILPIAGRPMAAYALESVQPLLPASQLFGIVCAEDNITAAVENIFREVSPSAQIFEIAKRTAGPVQTILSIQKNLDVEAPLLLVDGDIFFKADSFLNRLLWDRPFTAIAGGNLLSFESSNIAYSYVREGSDRKVIEIAEKKVISRLALIGAYHFRTAGDFLRSAITMVTAKPDQEHYISQVIGNLIEDGAHFTLTPSDFHLSFGTPDEVVQSERRLMEMNP
jgi:dTDP-glucose pyrophosphorylase